MRFGLLGPVEVHIESQPVALTGGIPNAVLALLLHSPNQVVSTDVLVDRIWGDAAPTTAVASLHNHVMRLRKQLGPQAGTRLRTVAPGYVMDVGDDELDVSRFEQACQDGNQALADERWEQARQAFTDALDLWRGEPGAGLPDGVVPATTVHRLRELRWSAFDGRVTAHFRMGRYTEALPDLRTLTAENPFAEDFHAKLMLALHESGRRGEALAVYRNLRRILMTELGVEPSADVTALNKRLLQSADVSGASAVSEASAGPAASEGAAPVPLTVPPAQLPARPEHFTGRDALVDRLCDRISATNAVDAPTVYTITGLGGVGKTALALHIAHRLKPDYPDGHLYVHLRGALAEPAAVLTGFLRDLGHPEDSLPVLEEELAGRFRSLVDGRRMLIVLDDARDAAQIRPLLPGSATCLVLITSRNQLVGLLEAHPVPVGVLDGEASRELLASIVGTQRVTAEPEAGDEIVQWCAGLPLALRIVAARLVSRGTRSLASVAARLADQRRRFDELAVADIAVRAVFVSSYEAIGRGGSLSGPDPARIFRMASLVPGQTVSGLELQALVGDPGADCEAALEALVEQHMLMPHGDHRYEFHDLLRDFATERVEAEDDVTVRRAARIRLAGYYAVAATAASSAVWQSAKAAPYPLEADPTVPAPPEFSDETKAMAWYAEHVENLIGAAGTAAEDGRPDIAIHLVLTLFAYAMSNPRMEYVALLERGIALADESHDLLSEAWLWRRLGVIHGVWERADECVAALEHSLELHQAADDEYGTIIAMSNLSTAYRMAERYEDCVKIGKQTLELIEARTENDIDAGSEYATLAHAYFLTGRYEEAVETFLKSLDLERSVKNRAASLNNLGDTYRAMGRLDDAVEALEASRSSYAALDDELGVAEAVHSLGRTYRDLGDESRAREYFLRAQRSYREIGFAPGIERLEADLAEAGGAE